jgi:3-dehydroquinate synthase
MGIRMDTIEIPAGESSKMIHTALAIVERLIALEADRKSALIALGGGVVGDITGFVASIYMRSIPYIQMPTSLLAMVDSSIGGKTGIDIQEGKNLLGTFYQPKGVYIDIDFLKTLPEREFRTGIAEIIKYGVIDDPELFHSMEKEAAELLNGSFGSPEFPDYPEYLERLVSRSGRIKKGIVEIDETERGLRRILNFGHTFGHAIEAESQYSISHGEAVSIGIVAATLLSEKMKYLSAEDRSRIAALIGAMGLPDRIPDGITTEGILSRMKRDKKKENDAIHFVLIKKIGTPFISSGVPEEIVRETIEEMK